MAGGLGPVRTKPEGRRGIGGGSGKGTRSRMEVLIVEMSGVWGICGIVDL